MKLKVKFTLIVSIFVIAIIALTAFFAFSQYKKSIKEMIARQQFLMISALADEIDNKLLTIQQNLISLAKVTPPDIMQNRERAQAFFDNKPILHAIFDGHVSLFTSSGKIFIESPYSPGRRGLDRSFREYIINTLKTKKPYISDPYISSRSHRHPVIMFTAPLFDDKGKMTGILAASIDLMRDNFLGRISNLKIGDTGFIYLTDLDRTLIMHADKKRILTKAAPGLNSLYDRAIDGFEGTDETVTSYKIKMLSSFKRVKAKNWILAANYPQSEAYRPIRQAEQYFLMATITGTIAIFFIISFIIKYLINPLELFTRHIEELPQKKGNDRFLNIKTRDEIGTLSAAFNKMVAEHAQAEDAMRRSEQKYRRLYENLRDGSASIDMSGRIVEFNRAYREMLGYAQEEIYQRSYKEITPERWHAHENSILREQVMERGFSDPYEKEYIRKDGTVFPVELTAYLVHGEDGTPTGMWAIVRDITKRKEAEQIMKQLYTAVEQTSDWILITDTDGIIEYANGAVERITGYTKEEIIGKNPGIFKSGRHDNTFYKNMWDAILSGQTFTGIMTNRRKDGELFEVYHTITPIKDSSGQIAHFVATSKDITILKQLEKQINFLATHDYLTGLPNRSLFVDRLRQVIQRAEHDGRYAGILFIDIDRLQLINDTFGSQAGDAFLMEIGKRLQTGVRDGDTVARFGSDEFAVSLIDMAKSDDIILILEDVRKALSGPFNAGAEEVMITFSMGVSIYPTDSKDIKALIENAVVACQKAKGLGGNSYQFFTPDMNSKASEFVLMERDMFNAIRHGEFILHYQPYYDMESRALVGMEALVRWRRGDGGLVPPGQFIPVLEQTGMIVEVGEWVLRETVRQVKEWQDKGYPVVPVSVNLSLVQFRQKNLVEVVQGIVQEHEVPPSLLVLEITETAFMDDLEFTKVTLEQLRSIGISISIDDFGTGYSSLSYLKRLPIDNLKIDISFIRDLGMRQDAESIVKAIVTMAHALNLKTIAEGIESEEQWGILRSMQCTIAQGFYCSKPLSGPEFEKLLTACPELSHGGVRREGKEGP